MNQRQINALERATNPTGQMNIQTVYAAAQARGLHDAEPGVNVLTFGAWKGLGRYVRKGEKALCMLVTFVPVKDRKDPQGEQTRLIKKTVAVFHISQTEAKDTTRH